MSEHDPIAKPSHSPDSDSADLDRVKSELDLTIAEEKQKRSLRRWSILLALLLLSLWISQRYYRPSSPLPEPAEGTVVFVDTAGWYRRSPDEAAVISPLDLRLDAMPGSFPMQLGDWQGQNRRPDPEVDIWFRSPEVVIERTYRRDDGEKIWVSAFGARGEKSFHLFEHVPEGCYPLDGWEVQHFDIARIPFGARPLPVNHGVAVKEGQQMVFFYLYIWDSPIRHPKNGLLSLRIAAPVLQDPDTTFAMLSQDFLPEIFGQTIPWSRF